jgi:protein-S-isoprenylcysteine O-methyltransferase Ste14
MWLFMKNLLFTVFVPGVIAYFVPLRFLVRDPAMPAEWGVNHIFGLALAAIGTAIYFWALWAFSVIGRATPAPIDAPKFVVLSGPFRYVRNPFYIGVVTAILGEALFFFEWRIAAYAGIVAPGFHLFVVFYEEPSLKRQFGEAYLEYKAAVRRWIPGKPYRPQSRA